MKHQVKEGDTLIRRFQFSQADVVEFARVTGDLNPLHLDPLFAASTIFKRPIIHGMLAGSVFTRFVGTEFSVNGFVYMKQTFEFLRPMFVERDYEVTFRVHHVDQKKYIAEIVGEIRDTSTNKITLRGIASLLINALP